MGGRGSGRHPESISRGTIQRQAAIGQDMYLPNYSGLREGLKKTDSGDVVFNSVDSNYYYLGAGYIPSIFYNDATSQIEIYNTFGTIGLYTGGWDDPIELHGSVELTYSLAFLSPSSGDYIFDGDTAHLGLYNATSGQQTQFTLYTNDGDGTDGCFFNIFGVGTIDDHGTNYEKLTIQYGAAAQIYTIKTLAGGTGTARPLYIYTQANTYQISLATSGRVGIGKDPTTYALEVSGEIQPTTGYRSTDGTAGLTTSKSWTDETAGVTHSVTVKNGLITSWSSC